MSSSGFHGKGDGSTAAKPYVICTFAQLRKIKDGLAKHYALGKDIDASSNQWAPIGLKSSQFTGSLDGRAYEVQKLKITGAKGPLSATEVAFFSYTSSSAVIRNIGLTNVNLNTIYDTVIDVRSMAGLVAYNGGTIVNSYVTGKVVNTTTGGTPISTAGLVGTNKVGGRIENSYAMANVTGEGTSTSTAAVNAAAAGGLVTSNKATIKNCYSHGNVTAKSGNKDSQAGGLTSTSFNSSPAAVLSNSYAAGMLSATAGGTASKHGFVVAIGVGTVSNNYWDTETSGSSTALAGTTTTGLSTAQMKAVSGSYPSALGDQFILTAGSYPKLKYGESSGSSDVDCGGSTNVTCGAAIRG